MSQPRVHQSHQISNRSSKLRIIVFKQWTTFKRDLYFTWCWLSGNNLAGRKPDKCRFHNVTCFAWLGPTACVAGLRGTEKSMKQRQTADRVGFEISVSRVANQRRRSGRMDIKIIFLSSYFINLFGENSFQIDKSNNYILNSQIN